MKRIVINSKGLVVSCNSMRFNYLDNKMVTLCGSKEEHLADLYIDEIKLRYKFQDEDSKFYDVVERV